MVVMRVKVSYQSNNTLYGKLNVYNMKRKNKALLQYLTEGGKGREE